MTTIPYIYGHFDFFPNTQWWNLGLKVSLNFKSVEIRKLLIFDHCAMGTVLMSCVMILAGMLIKNVGTNGCHSIISETMRIEKQRISPSFKIHGLMNS